MLTGKHLIAGNWVAGASQFNSHPATGTSNAFANASPALVDSAVQAADEASTSFGSCSRVDRARFLRQIAKEIEARGDEITAVAQSETGLPAARLEGERGRTMGQLNLFADCIESGDYLNRRITPALPEREPLPRPDLRLMMRPIGPVAVFGASNFPLAFSTAGGDTASALAAGSPVIVKGHPAHPGTSELVAQAILAAIVQCGVHVGVFSLLQDSGHDAARALVQHPMIKAVGFTGSLAAGRSLFDLCAARPEPIPFFGELGSINPSFVFPAAQSSRSSEIATGWAGSLSLGAGQFCTNPGVVFMLDGDDADCFVDSATASLKNVEAQTMLTDSIAECYREDIDRLEKLDGATIVLGSKTDGRSALPCLVDTTAKVWRSHPELAAEVFGPLGVVVRVESIGELMEFAGALDGQLTASLHMDSADHEVAASFVPILERKVGRLLANGFPTGVEVDAAMVHGGPYPASTNSSTTSVGTLAISRFLRPVCYQSIPESLLPEDLQL